VGTFFGSAFVPICTNILIECLEKFIYKLEI